MAILTSDSTISQIRDEYADAGSYHEDGSTAKAKRFITACRLLLLRLPKTSGQGGSQVGMNPELIREELDRAQRFIAAQGGVNGGVKHLSFRRFRR